MNKHTQGQTWRATGRTSASYSGRVTYDPAWSPSKPYCIFVGGTARINVPTLPHASQWLWERDRLRLEVGE
jgi:hypothetical protein